MNIWQNSTVTATATAGMTTHDVNREADTYFSLRSAEYILSMQV